MTALQHISVNLRFYFYPGSNFKLQNYESVSERILESAAQV